MSSSTYTQADQLRVGDQILIKRPTGPLLVRPTAVEPEAKHVVLRYAGFGVDGVLRPARTSSFQVIL